MITLIKQILNGPKQPDLPANIFNDRYFDGLLRDVEIVHAIFTPAYYHELKNIAYFPPKAQLYMRWIDNAITECLNQYLLEDPTNLSVSLIRFRHHEFTMHIESYIAQFDQRIQQIPLAYADIAGPNVDYTCQKEEKICIIIYFYAIAALAAAYFNWQHHFKHYLNADKIISTPTHLFYIILNHNLPQELLIAPSIPIKELEKAPTFHQRILCESSTIQTFYNKTNPKGFFAMQPVVKLSDDSKIKLIKEITKKSNTPFAIALLNYLKYYEHCQQQFDGFSKNNYYAHIAAALDFSVLEETIKKNFISINSTADSIRDKYSAWQLLKQAEDFYNTL